MINPANQLYHFFPDLSMGKEWFYMKNPNGYGTVVKLSGNRRKPYAVRKTEGFNEKGHPIYKNIGYAATKEEGLIMLAEYNNSPWDIQTEKITLKGLYDLWLKKKAIKLGESNCNSLKSAYNYCKKYETKKYNEIKAYHMQDCIDNCGHGYSTQAQIKALWGHLDKFATELDVKGNRYSSLLTSDPVLPTSKKIFTKEEIQTIWNNQQLPYADSILLFLYTGFRISELLNIKTSDIDLKERTIQGGNKTRAGKNRIVPIHSKILPIVEKRITESKSGYLLEYDEKEFSTSNYREIWNNLMAQLSMQHTPHETRHTFRSELDSRVGNKVCIDRLMGHKSSDTGERVYTHKTVIELKNTIELISY